MQRLYEDSQSSYVTALFADRALSFALQKGATLGDLVYRLTFLDGREPLAVTVTWTPTASGSPPQHCRSASVTRHVPTDPLFGCGRGTQPVPLSPVREHVRTFSRIVLAIGTAIAD
jgi:hypothetical protein